MKLENTLIINERIGESGESLSSHRTVIEKTKTKAFQMITEQTIKFKGCCIAKLFTY